MIDSAEAIRRVDPDRLDAELRPRLDLEALDERSVIATGIGASPGLVSGRVIFDSKRAAASAEDGETVILARPETKPEDLEGILAADGLLTSRGGKTSHAAVVARGLGRCCVCGVESVQIDTEARVLRAGDRIIAEGELLSLDGDGGRVLLGRAPACASGAPAGLDRLLEWADERRDLAIDALLTPGGDAALASDAGADGVVVQVSPRSGSTAAALGTQLGRLRRLSFAVRAIDLEPNDDAHRDWMGALAQDLRDAPEPPSHLIVPEGFVPVAAEALAAAGVGVLVLGEQGAPDSLAGSGTPVWVIPAAVDAASIQRGRSTGATRLAVGTQRVRAARLLAAQTA